MKALGTGVPIQYASWSDSGLWVVSGSVYPIAPESAFGPAENAIIIKSNRQTGCCCCCCCCYTWGGDTPTAVSVSGDPYITTTTKTPQNYNSVISIYIDTILSLSIHNNNNNYNNTLKSKIDNGGQFS